MNLFTGEQLTEDQAKALASLKILEGCTDEQIVTFQLFQERLCMDAARFQLALKNVLGRDVFTSQLSNPRALQQEYLEMERFKKEGTNV